MANINLKTANRVEVVESIIQHTAPCGEAIIAGDLVRLNPANGFFVKAAGGSAANARAYGYATTTQPAGMAVTALRKGVLDGFDLAALPFDADVFLADVAGRTADAAGTTPTKTGRIIGGHANVIGQPVHKLLMVDL